MEIDKIKTALLSYGYLDNEWLDKYLQLLKNNESLQKSTSTQAHHAIPVKHYWTSLEPYNRMKAFVLARKDPINVEVNLLYKDHLLAHAYLTLCTDLQTIQEKYDAQVDLRWLNSKKGNKLDLNLTKEEVKERRAAYLKKFMKEYHKRPYVKEKQKQYVAKYFKTEKGKAALNRSLQKYYQKKKQQNINK